MAKGPLEKALEKHQKEIERQVKKLDLCQDLVQFKMRNFSTF